MSRELAARVLELTERHVPFVHATVVRAQVPTSAHPGDEAIVYPDGTIDGFVGGVCAENAVRTGALGTLRDGRSVLLRVLPEGDNPFPETPGARVLVNPCLSGGALEIFLEPRLPPPLIEVVGDSPVTEAFDRLAEVLGYRTAHSLPGGVAPHTAAAVVAGHGRHEDDSLRAALDAGVPHIALVASRRRGSAVLDELGLTEAERARVSTPAGLDIHARTAAEIALSILAEVVERLRSDHVPAVSDAAEAAGVDEGADPARGPVEAVDPVCGMTVTVVADTPHLSVDGTDVWFCGTHCRDRFAAERSAASAAAEGTVG